MTQFRVNFLLPPPSASDVARREFAHAVDGGQSATQVLAANETQVSLVADKDATLTVSLVDIDDANNRSPARTLEFVVTDMVAPGQPGDIVAQVVEQID